MNCPLKAPSLVLHDKVPPPPSTTTSQRLQNANEWSLYPPWGLHSAWMGMVVVMVAEHKDTETQLSLIMNEGKDAKQQ